MTTKMAEANRLKDTMRREYDVSGGVRGKYAGRIKTGSVMITLAPDVAAAFPDAEAVNEALRVLLKAARKASKKAAAA